MSCNNLGNPIKYIERGYCCISLSFALLCCCSLLLALASLHLLTLGAHAQRGLRYLIGLCVCCVCVCVCVCMSVCLMPYFSDTVSLHVERKVPMALVRHCADYYKKGFCDRRFIHKLWCHLLTHDILRGYCSVIPRSFSTAEPSKGPKKANNRLNATLNTTRCKALFSLVSVLPKTSVYFSLHIIISLVGALSRIRACVCYIH